MAKIEDTAPDETVDDATEVAETPQPPRRYSPPRPRPTRRPAPRVRCSTSPARPSAAARRRSRARASSPAPAPSLVNGRTLEEYFPNKLHQQLINDPFKVLDLLGSYDVIAKITGGGPSGQAGALRLAIARSLNEIDRENNRPALKKAGFLTRDARVIERKKAGLKKARKASQFSKR